MIVSQETKTAHYVQWAFPEAKKIEYNFFGMKLNISEVRITFKWGEGVWEPEVSVVGHRTRMDGNPYNERPHVEHLWGKFEKWPEWAQGVVLAVWPDWHPSQSGCEAPPGA